jgi:DegV family protein with EDD domain
VPSIAIVTDSSACLPRELLDRHRIESVPLGLIIGGEVYEDGSLTCTELFARTEASGRGAQTTSPAPSQFLEAFGRARGAGADAVLCLTLSQAFSGTFAAAQGAAELARDALPGFSVRVVDTGGIAMTHGLAVLAAARALEAGASLDETAEIAKQTGSHARLLGALHTLDYLVKGGRVPWIVAWAASVLRIKPVLSFEGGKARSIARPRTWERAQARMLDEVARVKVEPTIAVMHSGDIDRANELAAAVCERFRPTELLITEFTSVMAVHTGPGFIGVAFSPNA